MPSPYRPMLPSSAPAPPSADGWAHEPKVDGWRAIVTVGGGTVRVWSRAGRDWTARVPELGVLARLGAIVLDGELVVAAANGRADLDLLTGRLHGDETQPSVTLSVFDVVEVDGEPLVDQPWSARRATLDELDLVARTDGTAQVTVWGTDGAAMHLATAATGAEGTVSKQMGSRYRPGRSRAWLKAKHRLTGTFQIAGWRPTTPSRPGGLVLAEAGESVGVAAVALPDAERSQLVDLFRRYGQPHPTGVITIPAECLTASVEYSSRTPTHRRLREATVLAVRPSGVETPDRVG